MKKYSKHFKSFGKLLTIMAELKPMLIFWMIISAVFQSANVFVNIYIPKFAIDLISHKNWDDFPKFLLATFLVKFFISYFQDIVDQKTNHESSLFQDLIAYQLSNKAMKMKYHYLEDPHSLELKEEAWAIINFGSFYQIIISFGELLASLFIIVGITAILLSFSPILFLVITILAIIGILIESYISVEKRKFIQELVPINRKFNYYFSLLLNKDYQKDFRLYDLYIPLIEKVSEYNIEISERFKLIKTKEVKATFLSKVFSIISSFILYVYAGLRVLGVFGEKIILGNFVVLVTSNESYSNAMKTFGYSIVYIITMLPVFDPLIDYLSLEEMDEGESIYNKKEPGKLVSLTFENVSFSYPKTDKKILDGITFTLNEGEILSIVGINNSGKSTIVKLICRLFEPDEGRILWNGIDIREFTYESYLKELSCVFQDFKLFPMMIWENIDLGRTEISDEEELPKYLEERIINVIEKVGIYDKVQSLERGIYTYLDKNLHKGGIELSGGQSQKLAIARAIYGQSSVAILDEPTAALDPLAEAETYENFANLVKGKTAIFISHRMSASKFSDRILILENGKITGNGSHYDLMNTNKLYQNLYQAQAKYYQ